MNNEASSSEEKYKVVEYNEQIFCIPVRRIQQSQYLFLSDVQALVPAATAFTSTDKLIPFETDPTTHEELLPKRVAVSEFNSAWQVHVPEGIDSRRMLQAMDGKLDRLSRQLRRLMIQPLSNETTTTTSHNGSHGHQDLNDHNSESDVHDDDTTNPLNGQQEEEQRQQQPTPEEAHDDHTTSTEPPLAIGRRPRVNNHTTLNNNHHPTPSRRRQVQPNHDDDPHDHDRPESPPPAFTTSPLPTRRMEGEAPPSYETSILGNIKALTDQLRLYESHIANRHKSPRWLSRRHDWIDREPSSIEQVAYQLVQLEMALLWTAVSESWIQERETWLTLVASARTERHLAGAMLNLERHTLVMDDAWVNQVRETWTNELLEMIVLPLTHG
ncbi:hypothetical protein BDA99DRAFT_504954 [Phascolomyces articulosus]|uniref:Uncharacterized protein n=1 Tax=Phascolomyces articulosus TaxID=60185 RepID=A0AAD5PFX0_9FUNG|nr:hypothetical protein BDA99DRAFT_504954 [Phascolomyces articulosus]